MATAQNVVNDNQTDKIVEYITRAMNFMEVNPQEKVYLHIDNTGYFKGETIYFKAYVMRNDANGMSESYCVPTDKSEILYVDLLNSYGEPVAKRKLKIVDGEANGDIKLDNCIQRPGFYELRAYTRYMMNFGDDAAFSRVLPIFQKPKTEGDYSDPVIDKLGWHNRLPVRDSLNNKRKWTDVKFFPEGGDCIEGITSRVAYIMADEDGEIERGLFDYTPSEGNGEREFKDRKGKAIRAKMPKPLKSGCAMRVEAVEEDDIGLKVQCTEDMRDKLLAYILMHEGKIIECDTFTCADVFTRKFARKGIPEGVSQLTVIDSDGHIRAERLFFICPKAEDTDSIRISTGDVTLTPCGKVTMKIQGQPCAHYSFSAMDASTMVNGDAGSMRSYMLLGSDIRGYIANPEYYFEADDEEHRKAADLLMMTQGWRRYDFEFMDGTKSMEKIQPLEKEINIYGKVLDRKKRTPVEGATVKAFLYNRNDESMSGESKTDKNGYYIFQVPDLYEDWNMQLVITKDDKPINCIATIDRRFAPKARYISADETRQKPMPHPIFNFELDSVDNPLLMKKDGEYHIGTVTIKRKRYFTDDSNMRWRDENFGLGRSVLFYNCEDICDELYDRGEDIPEVYTWLAQKNEFFSLKAPEISVFENMFYGDLQFIPPGNGGNIKNWTPDNSPLPSDEGIYEYDFLITNTSRSLNMYSDGYKYKNRPVVWILNNSYGGCTGVGVMHLDIASKTHADSGPSDVLGRKYKLKTAFIRLSKEECTEMVKFDDCKVEIPTNGPMPILLDEVKSIYISEEPRAFNDMIKSNELEAKEAATIFLYTYPRYSTESQKGRRHTHFQGYNKPTKFEMEDYGIVPPVADDFRRTLFWAPFVIADKKGEATVEFYNNSTCKEMYISVEGITNDGRFVNN